VLVVGSIPYSEFSVCQYSDAPSLSLSASDVAVIREWIDQGALNG
jgi:hypothetical protein